MHNMKTHAVTAVATRIGRIARFLDDRRGVSAVEFAMLLPLMVTLYLGSVETSQGIATSRKVTLTAHTLADLTTHILRSQCRHVEHPQCRVGYHSALSGERSAGRRFGALSRRAGRGDSGVERHAAPVSR